MRLSLPFPTQPHRRAAGFTIVEFAVASLIATLVIVAVIVFAEMATRSLSGITKQNALNEEAGHVAEVIRGRVRLANGLSNDSSGVILTLSFDDNINVDSNGDGNPYNDTNHFEQFRFVNGDNQDSTVENNRMTYVPDTTSTNTTVLLAGGVRKLPNLTVFKVTNNVMALINFGLLDSQKADYVQAVEIKTSAVRRN